jgi:ADP-ribose pyrophosphatase
MSAGAVPDPSSGALSPGTPALWARGDPRVLLTTRVFEVRGVPYRHPQRQTGREFVVVHAPDWVNVVAVTESQEVVLVRQFRFGTDALSLEVPGGVMEPGEDPIEAGRRELQEETGFVGGEARVLGWVHPNPAIQSNRCHLVCIEGVRRDGALAWDPDEELEVVTLPMEEVFGRVGRGEITHALALNALFLFAAQRRGR